MVVMSLQRWIETKYINPSCYSECYKMDSLLVTDFVATPTHDFFVTNIANCFYV